VKLYQEGIIPKVPCQVLRICKQDEAEHIGGRAFIKGLDDSVPAGRALVQQSFVVEEGLRDTDLPIKVDGVERYRHRQER